VNGAHDMGGVHGFGPVVPEADEPVFHDEWERRAFALTIAMGATGAWNIDMSRSAREDRPPGEYLSMTYYELWFAGLERLLADVDRPLAPLRAENVATVLGRGGPVDRPCAQPARFTVGSRVRALNLNPRGHTRLPRYVRGKVGEITAAHGCHVFPDANAHGDENPQWLYTVAFSGPELFGPQGDPTVTVSVDAWEPYLEAEA
jgi:nitrile hydratase